MATIQKFYLHAATTSDTGTLPSSSPLGGSATNSAPGAETNRAMDGTVGASQTSATLSTTATTSAVSQNWFARFLSAPLAAQTIASGTWTLSIAGSESSANSNFAPSVDISVWRPGTGAAVGTIFGHGLVSTPEPGTTQTALAPTFSGSSLAIADGDILVLELWGANTQSMASSYTNTLYYDGTTEASTTSCASFLNAPAALTLASGSPTGTASGTGSAAGVGSALDASVGTASGSGTAAGVGSALDASVGTASGTGTAAGVGSATDSATGTASGSATASATGSTASTSFDDTFAGTTGAAITGSAGSPTPYGSDTWTTFSPYPSLTFKSGGGATSSTFSGTVALSIYPLTGSPAAGTWTYRFSSSSAVPQVHLRLLRTVSGNDEIGLYADYPSNTLHINKTVAGTTTAVAASQYSYTLATGTTYSVTATVSGTSLSVSISDGATDTPIASGLTIPTPTGTAVLLAQVGGSAGHVTFAEVRFDPLVPSAGTASGSATASGVGAATDASTGTASGSATAGGTGKALDSSAGTASGSGSAAGVGSALDASTGTATGSGSAAGVGAATDAATGTASGSGTAAGVGSALDAATGTASGSGTAAGVGSALDAATGTASGSGTAAGVGASTTAGSGVGTASGSGTASGVGSALDAATGTASGSGSAAGVGAATDAATGTASGSGTASGVGSAPGSATGTASGSGTASGVGSALVAAAGTASGSGTASAVGDAAASGSTGSATGTATASGVGASADAATGTASGSGTAAGSGARSTDCLASTVDVDLVTYLGAAIGLPIWAPLLTGRKYRGPVNVPDSPVIVNYHRVRTSRERILRGSLGIVLAHYQIDVFGQLFDDCLPVVESIRCALQDFTGTIGSTEVLDCYLDDQNSTWLENEDPKKAGKYRIINEYCLIYRETVRGS